MTSDHLGVATADANEVANPTYRAPERPEEAVGRQYEFRVRADKRYAV